MLTQKLESMRSTFGNTLSELSASDETIYVLDGDLANSTKIDLVAKNNPDKFLQMGIAEQNMVSVAAGLATVGLQPWAVTFAAFLSKRALDQVQVQVAQPNLNVKLVGAYGGLLTGLTGKSHQALEDVAIFRSLANMTILSPADAVETEAAIRWAASYEGPVYIRLARDEYPVIFDEQYTFEFNKAVVLKEGADVTLISTGTSTGRALEAAQRLEGEGISASVLHLHTLKPVDQDAIIQQAKLTNAIVTVEEHSVYGGLGSLVSEITSHHYPVPVEYVGVKDINAESASNDDLLEKYELTPSHIVASAKRVLARK
jgi:transketolase